MLAQTTSPLTGLFAVGLPGDSSSCVIPCVRVQGAQLLVVCCWFIAAPTHIGSRFRRASGSDSCSAEGHRKLFRTRSLGSLKGGANGVIALLNGKGQEFESPTPVFSPQDLPAHPRPAQVEG